jgi:phage terminase large subunit
MSKLSKQTKDRQVLQALIQKTEAKAAQNQQISKFDLTKLLFKEQYNFVTSPSRFKCAYTSRRAGKTSACAYYLAMEAMSVENAAIVFGCRTKSQARRCIWQMLKDICQRHFPDAVPNETEAFIKFPNGSIIYLAGFDKKKSELDKFRGLAVRLIILDECQSYSSFIFNLINDVFAAALVDYRGSLVLTGTPNPCCSGTFYEACHKLGDFDYMDVFHWDMSHNTFLLAKRKQSYEVMVQEELKTRHLELDDPAAQREFFGRWVRDVDAQLYRYSPLVNSVQSRPLSAPIRTYMGLDLGFEDADALIVAGVYPGDKRIYVIEQWKESKQTITDLESKIREMVERHKPVWIVADAGALGKKIVAEFLQRGLQIEAADKARKSEHIRFLNDDLVSGTIQIEERSMLASEMSLLTYETTEDGKLVEGDSDNHLCDAFLYVHNKITKEKQEVAKPKYGTPEYWKQFEIDSEEEDMEQAEAEAEYERTYGRGAAGLRKLSHGGVKWR